PGNVRSASEPAMRGTGSGVVRPVKWQMHLERKVNVNRARQKRKHAEGETHHEAEEIKIRPGHKSPRTRHLLCATSRCAARAGIRDASPVNCCFELFRSIPLSSGRKRTAADDRCLCVPRSDDCLYATLLPGARPSPGSGESPPGVKS